MGLLMNMGVSRGSHLAHIALDAEPSAHLDTREHPEAAGEVGAAAVDDAARVFLARHLARVRERRYLAPARHDSFKLDPQECRKSLRLRNRRVQPTGCTTELGERTK